MIPAPHRHGAEAEGGFRAVGFEAEGFGVGSRSVAPALGGFVRVGGVQEVVYVGGGV